MSWENFPKIFATQGKKKETPHHQQSSQTTSLHKAFSAISSLPSLVSSQSSTSQKSKQEISPNKRSHVSTCSTASGSPPATDLNDSLGEEYTNQAVAIMSQYDDIPMDTANTTGTENMAISADRSIGKSLWSASEAPSSTPIPSKRAKVDAQHTKVLVPMALERNTMMCPGKKHLPEDTSHTAVWVNHLVKRKRHSETEDRDMKMMKFAASEELEKKNEDKLEHARLLDDAKLIEETYLQQPSARSSEDFNMSTIHPCISFRSENYNSYKCLADPQEFHGIIDSLGKDPFVSLKQLVDWCKTLLENLVSDLFAPRLYAKKDFFTPTFYDMFEKKALKSVMPWYRNELHILLRRSLSLLVDVLGSHLEMFTKDAAKEMVSELFMNSLTDSEDIVTVPKNGFLELMKQAIELGALHSEAHLLEGNFCAFLHVLGLLGEYMVANEMGTLICHAFCHFFKFEPTPHLLLHIMQAGTKIVMNQNIRCASLCENWRCSSDSKPCQLLKVSEAVKHLFTTKYKDMKLNSQFYPPEQPKSFDIYIEELHRVALKWLNALQCSKMQYSDWSGCYCDCFYDLLKAVLHKTFLLTDTRHYQLSDDSEQETMLALEILHRVRVDCSDQPLHMVLGDIYLSVGNFTDKILHSNGSRMAREQVAWANYILEDFKGAKLKTVPRHGELKLLANINSHACFPTSTWRLTETEMQLDTDDSQDSF